ncbi:MAG: hypothetical protein KY475_16845 [Planctomycetes bacterium]|nr:hypothetical protein [Planctomycetota bacterium]
MLSGLQFPKSETVGLFKEIVRIKESTTYQYIIEQGMEEGKKKGIEEGQRQEARKMLLLTGEGRLGKPGASVATALDKIDDLDRLHRMSRRLWDVESWKELLKTQ